MTLLTPPTSRGRQPKTRIGLVISRLRLRDWAWLHYKLIVGVAWPVALLLFPPTGPALALGPAFALVAFVTIGGSLVSMTGLVASRQRGGIAVVGLTIEVVGILFMLAGVVAYWLTQVALLGGPDGKNRIALAFFAYGMGAAIVARLVIVLTDRHDAATRPSLRVG